jgi:hypothetical protein
MSTNIDPQSKQAANQAANRDRGLDTGNSDGKGETLDESGAVATDSNSQSIDHAGTDKRPGKPPGQEHDSAPSEHRVSETGDASRAPQSNDTDI